MATTNTEATQSATKRLLSLPEVAITTGLSKQTIYRNISAGTFPAPLKVSTRRVAWIPADIDSWLSGLNRTS
jgi:prophage regulatory protein